MPYFDYAQYDLSTTLSMTFLVRHPERSRRVFCEFLEIPLIKHKDISWQLELAKLNHLIKRALIPANKENSLTKTLILSVLF